MFARLTTERQPLDSVIELWCVDLDRELPVDHAAILSLDEEERASRFLHPRHALHYRNSHLLVRFGLAWHLGIAPQAVRWEVGSRGKPMLPPEARLFFSLSHCDHFAVAAFTSDGELGVDVEPSGRTADALSIACRYFAPDEVCWIKEATTEHERANRFLWLWTRKEALMKATGKGLNDSLLAVCVLDGVVSIADGNGQSVRWRVEDLATPFAAIGAVAALDGPWKLRSFYIEPDDLAWMAEKMK